MQIQPLNYDDIATAFIIEQQCHAFPWSEKLFRSNFGERYLNYKLVKDRVMVGYAITQTIGDEATLFNIAVAPQYQRHGYGKTLLTELITQLQCKKIATLWLEVRYSNAAAIALYEQLGFNQVTIRKDYYPTQQGREDAIVMANYLI